MMEGEHALLHACLFIARQKQSTDVTLNCNSNRTVLDEVLGVCPLEDLLFIL